MIERQHGRMTLMCDECEENLPDDYGQDHFNRMVREARARGWTIRPDGDGGYRHFCSRACAVEHHRGQLGL